MLETFGPLLRAAQGVSLDDPVSAVAELNARLDPQGEEAAALNIALKALLDEGRIKEIEYVMLKIAMEIQDKANLQNLLK